MIEDEKKTIKCHAIVDIHVNDLPILLVSPKMVAEFRKNPDLELRLFQSDREKEYGKIYDTGVSLKVRYKDD